MENNNMFPKPDMANPTPLIFGVPMINPMAYRPKVYVNNIEVGAEIGGTGKNTTALDKYPFIWTHTTFALKDIDRDEQDCNFLCQPKTIERYYTSDFARPDELFGNPFDGPLIPWPVPVFVEEATSIFMEIINQKDRTEVAEQFIVQFCFHGIERWQKDE